MCVCNACHVSFRFAVKAKENGERYQLRWLKSKSVKVRVCCVQTCDSVNIKAEKQFYLGDDMCFFGIASIESPGDISLCTKHY